MKWIFLNTDFIPEEEATLHISDLSIQRGYGVFDYLKVIDDEPVFPEEHLQGFLFSASQMRLQVRFSTEELKTIIGQLIAKNDAGTSGIRLTLTGGYAKDGYTIASSNFIIQQQPLALPDEKAFEKGIRLVSYEHVRPLAHVKSINYLMGIWLQDYIQEHESNDVLYHGGGVISECPRANIFLVTHDDVLLTPSRNILKGITRQKILDHATFVRHEERDITLEELYNAREVFITSTTKQVMPVTAVDGRIINNGTPGRITMQVLRSLQTLQAARAFS